MPEHMSQRHQSNLATSDPIGLPVTTKNVVRQLEEKQRFLLKVTMNLSINMYTYLLSTLHLTGFALSRDIKSP